MKIAIDISPLQNGNRHRGIGTYARGLLSGLTDLDSGDDYYLFYWGGLPLERAGLKVPAGTQWVGVPLPRMGRGSLLIGQQLLLAPFLRFLSPDVFHQLGIVADPSAGGLPWHFLRRSVATLHDLTPLAYRDRFLSGKRARSFIYGLMLKAAAHSNQVIVDSAATHRDAIKLLGLRPDRLAVVPLAPGEGLVTAFRDSRRQSKPQALPDNYLLSVAGDHPNKGLKTLLAAYVELVGAAAPPELVIVGRSGPAIAQIRHEFPAVAARLHVYSYLSEAELAWTYRRAMAVIVPSEYEGFGLPLLEAMAAGTPAIASDAPSLVEAAGEAALFFKRLDSHQLADAVWRLCESPELRLGMMRRGLDRVGQFSWSRTARLTTEVYARATSDWSSGKRRVPSS